MSSKSTAKTDSSQTQIQESADNRIVAATDSVNLVANKSTIGNVSISQTDHGAVDSSFKFADSISGKAFNFAETISAGAANELAASAASQVTLAKTAMQSVQDAYKNSNDTMAAAYETSKAGEQKVMVAGALALVALVAFKGIR